MTANIHVVIMAGGIGSRFWPMSTPQTPKQFVDVLGVGKSMIQMTVERFDSVCPPQNFWVVTGEAYVETVAMQLPQIPREQILAEPVARNTAPCVAFAAWKIRKKYPSANLVFTPADALVLDQVKFRSVISEALEFTESQRRIVTIGIKPSRPETGYGYIEANGEQDASSIQKVNAFKEKPCLELAKEYLAKGGYYWNAGIFVWNVGTVVDCIREYVPSLAQTMDSMAEAFYTSDESDVVKSLFPTCEKISIDYAVMEKADCIYTLPADFGWSDLGTWGALRTLLPQDEDGNALVGNDIRMFDSKGCIVHAPGLERVVIQGLEDCIVAQHNGFLLVCRLDKEQNITTYGK